MINILVSIIFLDFYYKGAQAESLFFTIFHQIDWGKIRRYPVGINNFMFQSPPKKQLQLNLYSQLGKQLELLAQLRVGFQNGSETIGWRPVVHRETVYQSLTIRSYNINWLPQHLQTTSPTSVFDFNSNRKRKKIGDRVRIQKN